MNPTPLLTRGNTAVTPRIYFRAILLPEQYKVRETFLSYATSSQHLVVHPTITPLDRHTTQHRLSELLYLEMAPRLDDKHVICTSVPELRRLKPQGPLIGINNSSSGSTALPSRCKTPRFRSRGTHYVPTSSPTRGATSARRP
jgi:hypothetical protein